VTCGRSYVADVLGSEARGTASSAKAAGTKSTDTTHKPCSLGTEVTPEFIKPHLAIGDRTRLSNALAVLNSVRDEPLTTIVGAGVNTARMSSLEGHQ
jgi:hypothetical protein